jgi:hypothetical protein
LKTPPRIRRTFAISGVFVGMGGPKTHGCEATTTPFSRPFSLENNPA